MKCPHCGHEFIEGQSELGLGPFFVKKKLDNESADFGIINYHHKNFDDDDKKNNHAPSNLTEAYRHPYWKQFTRYCETRRGNPTLKGFCTWLTYQVPPRTKPTNQTPPPSSAIAPPPQPPDLFDEINRKRFISEFMDRKQRRRSA